MIDRLAGKVVVLTGAARGQGAEEARALAAEGAFVVATDVLDFEAPVDGGQTAHVSHKRIADARRPT